MFGFSSLHVKPAAGSLNKFAFNPVHVTTADFGQLNLAFSRTLYPRESISINMRSFMRTEVPLVRPTFGKVQVKTAAIAVPMKRVFIQSEGFFGNKSMDDGTTPVTRTFTWFQFCMQMIHSEFATIVTEDEAYDFFVNDSATSFHQVYYRFTNKGRQVYKILRSLGYQLPTNINQVVNSPQGELLDSQYLSAVPLLAFLTAYLDCFYPRAKASQSTLARYLYIIRMQSASQLTDAQMNSIFLALGDIALYYGNSYLTSAWESPVSPLAGQLPLDRDESIFDRTRLDVASVNIRPDTGVVGTTAMPNTFSPKAIDYLERVQRWFKRNMLSGSRAYEALKSQFGINNPHSSFDYSQIIDVTSAPLMIGDVTASSASQVGTEDTSLGDIAGKAVVDGKSHFKFTCKEHCMLFIFSWFSIEPFMWNGIKRDVLRLKPLDYYQPEFDGLDSQPIVRAEVATNSRAGGIGTNNDLQVWGFVNRFDDMRFENDMLTGDLSLTSFANEVTEPWHFGRRDMVSIVSSGYKAMSDKVIRVNGPEYDSIFADYNTDADHFNVQHLFDITLMSPMQSFNEVAQLGVGDLKLERNGNQLS